MKKSKSSLQSNRTMRGGEMKRFKHFKRFVFVKGCKWGVRLTFYDFSFDNLFATMHTPIESSLIMLSEKGRWRNNARPFDTICEISSDTEILTREEAEVDARFRDLAGYFADVDERVALYWNERKDKPCSPDVAPSNEKMPEKLRVTRMDYGEPLYGFERGLIIIGETEGYESL